MPYDRHHAFTYHPPSPEQLPVYEEIRAQGYDLAGLFERHAPESRELSLARTKLEEAVMWANAAIARNGLRAPLGIFADPEDDDAKVENNDAAPREPGPGGIPGPVGDRA